MRGASGSGALSEILRQCPELSGSVRGHGVRGVGLNRQDAKSAKRRGLGGRGGRSGRSGRVDRADGRRCACS
jgi:hypothetical protein